MKDYSQHGEGLLLKDIFDALQITHGYAVEFGASDGYWLSNIRGFLEMGWTGLQLEGITRVQNEVKQEFITKENINELFAKYNVPTNFDLLSIDLDGNDYWIWKELHWNPKVVIIEYNSNFTSDESYALHYDANHNFYESGGFYSASAKAFVQLAKKKGYFLYKEVAFVNLIFIRNDFASQFDELDYTQIQPKHHHGGKNLTKFEQVS